MAMKIQIMLFWVVTPYSDVVEYHHFWGPCYLHHQKMRAARKCWYCTISLCGITTQKTICCLFLFSSRRQSNF